MQAIVGAVAKSGAIIINGSYRRPKAKQILEEGVVDSFDGLETHACKTASKICQLEKYTLNEGKTESCFTLHLITNYASAADMSPAIHINICCPRLKID